MAKAKPGDTCINCGERVRKTTRPGGDLSSSFDPEEQGVTCGCDSLVGPVVADER